MVVFPYGLFGRISPMAVKQGVLDAYYELTSTKYFKRYRVEELKYEKQVGVEAHLAISQPSFSPEVTDSLEVTKVEVEYRPRLEHHHYYIIFREEYSQEPNLLTGKKHEAKLMFSDEMLRIEHTAGLSKSKLERILRGERFNELAGFVRAGRSAHSKTAFIGKGEK